MKFVAFMGPWALRMKAHKEQTAERGNLAAFQSSFTHFLCLLPDVRKLYSVLEPSHIHSIFNGYNIHSALPTEDFRAFVVGRAAFLQ